MLPSLLRAFIWTAACAVAFWSGDGVLSAQSSEPVYYYHTDGIGSVRMITNEQGQVVERHEYQPFGVEVSPPSSSERLRFAGKEHDPETGASGWVALDYFGARYLHSATGRFTTPDPVVDIQTALLIPERWNMYAYVLNNPVRYTDPDGRCVFVIADTLACAAGAITTGVVVKAAIATAVIAGAAWLGHAMADEADADDVPKPSGAPPGGRGLDDILKDDALFDRWVNHKHPNDRPLSPGDAQKVWDKLVQSGRQPRLDKGHPGTQWEEPHINVDGTSIHIPVTPGFIP